MSCQCASGGCSTEVPELNIDMHAMHAMHAVKNGTCRIIVLSSDTDVFVMLMYYWDELHSHGLRELWVKTGIGDSTRYIPIHTLASRVGPDLCKVLPAVYSNGV